MASPLPSRKQSVSLASPGPKVSRIRRDPPPPALPPEVVIARRNERDAWMVAIGIVAFALALVVVAIALVGWAGWSPSNYEIRV